MSIRQMMINNYLHKILWNSSLLLALLIGGASLSLGQALQSSKQELEGLTFYQDLKNPQLYYYAPGKLRLAKESDGAPKLQIVFTRYTGTRCGGDQGEKQFLNLVQLTAVMEKAQARQLRAAKLALGEDVTIRPLSIQNVEAYLVVPVGDSFRRLGGVGSSEANSEGGSSSKRSYWTERTFTLRLSNEEAQLLQNLLKEDKLALSINYSFYADLVQDVQRSLDISGNSDRDLNKLEEKLEKVIKQDSIPVLQSIAGGAFAVSLDFASYPEKLKKIDINEAGIPTDYPAMELRCYDFANELRPDLNMKEIQIKALGIGGRRWIELDPITFSRFQPDLNVQQVKFSQAVNMGTDFRYQVIEHPKAGDVKRTGWKSMPFCSSLLDVSTDLEASGLRKRSLEIEVPVEQFAEKSLAAMTLVLDYQLDGKPMQQFQVFEANSVRVFRQLSLIHDRDTDLNIQTVWHYSETSADLSPAASVDEEDYIFCKLPE
ncbi:MAG: hypothetical protein R8P61_32415 [Bacteroidia bacterium]|nr:hypothetical protein [Bacteroidia bacterium]